MDVVATAYVMHKTPNVFPIIGGRKVELEAVDISLSKEQLEYLDGAVPFDPGFPTTIIVSFTFPTLSTFGLVECVGRWNELLSPPFVGGQDGEATRLAAHQTLKYLQSYHVVYLLRRFECCMLQG